MMKVDSVQKASVQDCKTMVQHSAPVMAINLVAAINLVKVATVPVTTTTIRKAAINLVRVVIVLVTTMTVKKAAINLAKTVTVLVTTVRKVATSLVAAINPVKVVISLVAAINPVKVVINNVVATNNAKAVISNVATNNVADITKVATIKAVTVNILQGMTPMQNTR